MKESEESMIDDGVRHSLEEYLQLNYSETQEHIQEYQVDPQLVKSGRDGLSDWESRTLEQLVRDAGESFHERLFSKIRDSGMSDVEVYKRANMDRKLFSKIRSNPAYHPRKQTVLALAIALRLTIDETVDLLARAEYALSPGNKRDLIVKYFIEQGIYDIMAVNYALDEYEQPLLE